MFRCDLRASILNDDRRPANTATIAGNMNGVMMMIDVDAHKLAKAPGSAKISKLCHKSRRIPGDANNSSVHIYHEDARTIYLRSRRQIDVSKGQPKLNNNDDNKGAHLRHPT